MLSRIVVVVVVSSMGLCSHALCAKQMFKSGSWAMYRMGTKRKRRKCPAPVMQEGSPVWTQNLGDAASGTGKNRSADETDGRSRRQRRHTDDENFPEFLQRNDERHEHED